MAKVFRPYVSVSVTHEGVPYWVMEGEEVDFSGTTMVRVGTVFYERSAWFSTEQEARRAAKSELASIADRIRKQAEAIE